MSSSPPYYVLLSHSTLAASSNANVNPAPTLVHPTIQYQYRDDPPLSLTNSHHVLVMDYDPESSTDSVHVQSLSPQIAVTSIKVADAPGTSSVRPDETSKNARMYVLETVAHQMPDKGPEKNEDMAAVVSLTGFKQRNALLRKALEYPLPSTSLPTPISAVTVSPRPSPHPATAALPATSPTA